LKLKKPIMKKSLFLVAIILSVMGGEIFGTPAITSWRWRNDNGNETTATWKTAERDSAVQSNESNIRLRMQMSHSGDAPVSYPAYLYYASLKDTVWHLVAEDPSDAFMFSLSSNVTNGGTTTQQLTPVASMVSQPGIIREMAGAFDFSLSKNQSKEYEFSVKPSSKAVFDQGYIFVIEDNDPKVASSLWAASTLPRLFLKKPELTVTAHNATRPMGTTNPVFTLEYSGFVDGDNEGVLNVPPQITCAANSGSAAGNYDIVPYGAADNKYKFKYVIGVLNVSSAVGLKDNVLDNIGFYPNPASSFIHLTGTIPANTVAKIFNMNGSLVLEEPIVGSTIDIRELKQGVYMLNLNGSVFKIFKE
jgi:hypothetical protein